MPSENSKWSYIREIFNLKCNIGPQNISRRVKFVPVPDDLAVLIDKSMPYLGGRAADEKSWMIEVEPAAKVKNIHGDPEGALRLLPFAMLVIVSTLLKFGPAVILKIENNKKEKVGHIYDQLHTLIRMELPENSIVIDVGMIKELKQFFEKVIDYWLENLLVIPIDRFIRACLDKREDDGIIDLCIALESLYGGKKGRKEGSIACRVASFIGVKCEERERIYSDIEALFWARNEIVHKGVVSLNIELEDGRALDTKKILSGGFLHCAQALRKMLENPFWLGKTKAEVLRHFKNLARPLNSDFDSYKDKYQSITKNRN